MVQSIDVRSGDNNLITAVNKDSELDDKSIKWEEMNFEPNKINLKYDRNGNLTNDGVRSYFYDAENRLIKCNTSILLVNYKYDGLGRKVLEQETKDGAIFQENSFIYDGWSCVLELKTENLTLKTKSYIWGLDLSGNLQGAGGVGGLLSVESPFEGGAGGCYFYCYDGNGNVINLIDIDTKEIAAHYEYDPFGRLIEKEGVFADRNFYRFSTKRVSKVFGIYDYGMRWYDPDFARWLTKDPIGVKGGLNLYGFVGNNPVSFVDYNGMIIISGPEKIAKILVELKRALKSLKEALEFSIKHLEKDYECCIDGKWKKTDLTAWNGKKETKPACWHIPHKIMGCFLKRDNISKELVNALNVGWEAFEFVTPRTRKNGKQQTEPNTFGAPDSVALILKTADFITGSDLGRDFSDSEIKGLADYIMDTATDMQMVIQGYNSGGSKCKTKFIPKKCRKKKN